jgi:hypothetical protein
MGAKPYSPPQFNDDDDDDDGSSTPSLKVTPYAAPVMPQMPVNTISPLSSNANGKNMTELMMMMMKFMMIITIIIIFMMMMMMMMMVVMMIVMMMMMMFYLKNFDFSSTIFTLFLSKHLYTYIHS